MKDWSAKYLKKIFSRFVFLREIYLLVYKLSAKEHSSLGWCEYLLLVFSTHKGHLDLTSPVAIYSGFGEWKRNYFYLLNDENEAFFLKNSCPFVIKRLIIRTLVKNGYMVNVYIWGDSDFRRLENIRKCVQNFKRIEDGFLRSASLGAFHSFSYSWISADRMHYDFEGLAGRVSEAQLIFEEDQDRLAACKFLMRNFVSQKMSKYKLADNHLNARFLITGESFVLVIGQVKKDKAMIYGNPGNITDKQMVKAALRENPDKLVVYKPHPDTIIASRKGFSLSIFPSARVVTVHNVSTPLLLSRCSTVYCINSLVGFEGLLYGTKVVTFGRSWYSGYGVTEDRCPNLVQRGIATIEELFYAGYVLAPTYFYEKMEDPLSFVLTGLNFKESCFEATLRAIKRDYDFLGYSGKGPENRLLASEYSILRPKFLQTFSNRPEFDRDGKFLWINELLILERSDWFLSALLFLVIIDHYRNRHEISRDELIERWEKLSLPKHVNLYKYLLLDKQAEQISLLFYELAARDVLKLPQYRMVSHELAKKALNIEGSQVYRLLEDSWAKHLSGMWSQFSFDESNRLTVVWDRVAVYMENARQFTSVVNVGMLAIASEKGVALKGGYRLMRSCFHSLAKLRHSGSSSAEAEAAAAIIFLQYTKINYPSLVSYLKLMDLFDGDKFMGWSTPDHVFMDISLVAKQSVELAERPRLRKKLLALVGDQLRLSDTPAGSLIASYSGIQALAGEFVDAVRFICNYTGDNLVASVPVHSELLRICSITGDWKLGLETIFALQASGIRVSEMHRRKILFNSGHLLAALETFRELPITSQLQEFFGFSYCQTIGEVEAKSRHGCSDVPQRPLVVLAIFGPGDEIRFSRLYEWLACRYQGEILISCSPKLSELFMRSYPNLRFEKISRERAFEPEAFDKKSVPNERVRSLVNDKIFEYCVNSKALVTTVADLLPDFFLDTGGLRSNALLTPLVCPLKQRGRKTVGLSWRSSLSTAARDHHYASLEDFLWLFKKPEIDVVILQYDNYEKELSSFIERFPEYVERIYELTGVDQYDDLYSTSSIMKCLDLVISPATTVAELAAACGVETLMFAPSPELDYRAPTDPWFEKMNVVRIPSVNRMTKMEAFVDSIIVG